MSSGKTWTWVSSGQVWVPMALLIYGLFGTFLIKTGVECIQVSGLGQLLPLSATNSTSSDFLPILVWRLLACTNAFLLYRYALQVGLVKRDNLWIVLVYLTFSLIPFVGTLQSGWQTVFLEVSVTALILCFWVVSTYDSRTPREREGVAFLFFFLGCVALLGSGGLVLAFITWVGLVTRFAQVKTLLLALLMWWLPYFFLKILVLFWQPGQWWVANPLLPWTTKGVGGMPLYGHTLFLGVITLIFLLISLWGLSRWRMDDKLANIRKSRWYLRSFALWGIAGFIAAMFATSFTNLYLPVLWIIPTVSLLSSALWCQGGKTKARSQLWPILVVSTFALPYYLCSILGLA